jgi:hypothetical protein
VVITDGWVEEVRPDGTGKLIADSSAAAASSNGWKRAWHMPETAALT